VINNLSRINSVPLNAREASEHLVSLDLKKSIKYKPICIELSWHTKKKCQGKLVWIGFTPITSHHEQSVIDKN
jgi:hypothetical protein